VARGWSPSGFQKPSVRAHRRTSCRLLLSVSSLARPTTHPAHLVAELCTVVTQRTSSAVMLN